VNFSVVVVLLLTLYDIGILLLSVISVDISEG